MQTRRGLLIPLLLVLSGPVQSIPDFSGTWLFNKERSDPPIAGADASGPFGAGALFTETPESPVKITQSATELALQGPGGGRVTYDLRGREAKNAGPRGEMVSFSRWQKSTLVTRFRQTVSTSRGRMTIELAERRSISKDGRAMFVEVIRDTPRGRRTRRLVFDQQRE